MTVAESLSIVVVILTVALCISIAVLFSRALQKVLDSAQIAQDRHTEDRSKLLDRLMAQDFTSYKVQEMAEKPGIANVQEFPPDLDIPPRSPAGETGELRLVMNDQTGEYEPQEVPG